MDDKTDDSTGGTEAEATREIPEVTRLRGEVITDFATLEMMIDGIILLEYAGSESRTSFWTEVLADDQFTFGLRRNLLSKVLGRRGLLDKVAKNRLNEIGELGNLRNLFAHVGMISHDGEQFRLRIFKEPRARARS